MALDSLPKGMTQTKAPVLIHRRVAKDHYWMQLKAPQVAKRAQAGQFVHVLCDGKGSGELAPLLRRPFSLLDADPKKGTIDFVYKVVGLGTEVLAGVKSGAQIDLLGPLGQPFALPSRRESVFLIGGGVGIPPMVFLAKKLQERSQGNAQIIAFLGARTKEWVICTSWFRKLKVPIKIATDDGSQGSKGSVVDLVGKAVSSNGTRAQLYICGPTPMMAAAAKLAKTKQLPAQVSLEERMGCAMGSCWGCVVEVTTESPKAHARFQRVCTEGPVFPAEAVLWGA